ncbi:MAG: hypothetical protein O2967_04680 [Proteobacteria bacterium]|nr:hypothetical protein [Pseudomonadota bacterium]
MGTENKIFYGRNSLCRLPGRNLKIGRRYLEIARSATIAAGPMAVESMVLLIADFGSASVEFHAGASPGWT